MDNTMVMSYLLCVSLQTGQNVWHTAMHGFDSVDLVKQVL